MLDSIFEIFSRLNEPNLSLGLIFVIGVLAGFHCVGMCGGIVAAYTVYEEEAGPKGSSLIPHLQYNTGRIISYSLIGAVLGGIGSFFAINKYFIGSIMLLAGSFMLVFGISLFYKSPILRKIISAVPNLIMKSSVTDRLTNKFRGSFFIGLLNGFMPCGPLQAMQVYALASGSFFSGGLAMGVFALGTAPILTVFGSTLTVLSKKYMHKIFKFSGVLVAVLGIIMIYRGSQNFITPKAKAISGVDAVKTTQQQTTDMQIVNMNLTYRGYEPNTLMVEKGVPVKWVINVIEMSRCTNEIVIHGYNIRKKLNYGENIIEFTPKESGEIQFSCWMNMVWGKFIVN